VCYANPKIREKAPEDSDATWLGPVLGVEVGSPPDDIMNTAYYQLGLRVGANLANSSDTKITQWNGVTWVTS
jgi:hypothetical protein